MDEIYGDIILSPRRINRAEFQCAIDPINSDQQICSPTIPKCPEYAFKLRRKLAEGSYGAVYEANECLVISDIERTPHSLITANDVRETGKIIAVKLFINKDSSSDFGIPSITEIDVLSRLEHRFIMPMHYMYVVEFNTPSVTRSGLLPRVALAISMPFARHGDLYHFMQRRKMSYTAKIFVLWQILQGVKFLHHERIIHADIKPENIMVMSDNPPLIKIADFGMVIFSNGSGVRNYDRESVTITFRAPELFNDRVKHSRKIDIWSIGMTFLYLLLERNHIFPDVNPTPISRFIDRKFNDVSRIETLTEYIKQAVADGKTIMTSDEQKLAISFLDMALRYSSARRPNANTLLEHPIFGNLHQIKLSRNNEPPDWISIGPDSTQGRIFFNQIYKCNKITVDAYLAINFLIRLCLSSVFDIHIETFFLAMDIFNRSLANIYILDDYYRHTPNSMTISNTLSASAAVCLWIAQKAIESKYPNARHLSAACNNCYSPELLIDLERQLVVGLHGVIYQWNPFINCITERDLITEFDYVTNIFEYQNYTVKTNKTLNSLIPYSLKFKAIYLHTDYAKRLKDAQNQYPNNLNHALITMARLDYHRDRTRDRTSQTPYRLQLELPT